MTGVEVQRDRAAAEEFLRRIAAAPTTYRWEWEWRAEHAAGESGWVAAEGVSVVSDVSGERRYPYRMTLVLEQHDRRWFITLIHGSEPAQH